MKIPVVWLSGFVLGVSLFTPISSFNLGIDYYEEEFPGQQLAVKITICYELAFIVVQLICHFGDSKLPISRAARIELRHMAVAVLMVIIIVWDRFMVGPVGGHPPAYSVGVLLAIVTAAGIFDGMAIGAMFGEMAILGPEAAHAIVAGTAGVMPLLAVLRIICKAALPDTEEGLRLSLVLYVAAAIAVVLLGLAVYMFVILPAVAAVTSGHAAGTGLESELGVVTLVPTISFHSKAHSQARSRQKLPSILEMDKLDVQKVTDANGGRSQPLNLHSTSLPDHIPILAYSLPNSFRGSSILVRRVHTHLTPDMTRTGSMAGFYSIRSKSHQLQSWDRGRVRQPSFLRSITISCDPVTGKDAGQFGTEYAAEHASKEVQMQGAREEDGKDFPPGRDLEGVLPASAQHGTDPNSAESDGHLSVYQQEGACDSGETGVGAANTHNQHMSSTKSLVVGSQLLKQASSKGLASALLEDMILQANISAVSQEPKYFVSGYSVWKSNWLALKGNIFYMLSTILTYACNYGIYPGFISFMAASSVLGSWYSLVLVTTYGFGDLIGKLLPVWKPQRPQATAMALAVTRLFVFFPIYVLALLFRTGPWLMIPATFLLALSGWYEVMIFSLACEGQHPVDAYQVESMFAIQFEIGIGLGSVLSLAWAAGHWAS